jgi:hypothetical protein
MSVKSRTMGRPPGAPFLLIFPHDTGHRVKDHIMTMIQDEVLDKKGTMYAVSAYGTDIDLV